MQEATTDPASGRRDLALLLAASAVVGVVVGVGFEVFDTLSHELRDLLWVDWLGDDPASIAIIGVAMAGGLAVGVMLRIVPGHGGPHPAEHGELLAAGTPGLPSVVGTVLVGFVVIVAGASLGPEGALVPAVAGLGGVAGRWARLPDAMDGILPGSALAALLATMFGTPLAGAVPLLEAVPASGARLTMVILPALTASSTAVVSLQLLDAEAPGALPLEYGGFEAGYIGWAMLVGILAGVAGVMLDRGTALLRRATLVVEGRSPLLVTTLGGLVLGVIYAVAGDEVRFAGIPELLALVDGADGAGEAWVAVAAKLLATSWCLSVGFRGGKIFPLAFIGGAIGLAAHLTVDAVPLTVAIVAGAAGAIATGLRAPVTASLIAAALVGPELVPLAVLAVVGAHVVHLLSDQLASDDTVTA